MNSFFTGLLLLCASTLMYEVILTRLLSTMSWYYLAFVAVSTAMFGMTAGALAVQLKPEFFAEPVIRRRAYQGTLAAAISMPLALLVMLAVPFDVSLSLQTVVSFLIFSSVIAVPFFFSGLVVCISLTRMPFPTGRIYFADLAGAGLGCAASVGLLSIVDAPSAVFVISALLFLSAAAYANFANEPNSRKRCYKWAAIMLVVAALNAATIYGIQPIWAKGAIDRRGGILAEIWTPISKVRALHPVSKIPFMWGPSPALPDRPVEQIFLNIDNDAGTAITRFDGDLSSLWYLRYDVTAIAAQLRSGTAAVIGVGGGRDVLNCAANGFTRIVGIEINSAIVDLASRRLNHFSGFSKIPGFELHTDEGRSFLTRSGERFDLIQAALVDTWAATSAGAMSLSENALYTVDGWRVFYEHLKPGGIITFSRWYSSDLASETYRLFSVAHAMLLSEGVEKPENHLALIRSGPVATLLASNRPFTEVDIQKIRSIAEELSFKPMVLPGQDSGIPELQRISAARSLAAMAHFEDASGRDFSPTFDTSPYFFNGVHLRNLGSFLMAEGGGTGNLMAILVLFLFLIAAIVLVMVTILLPARKLKGRASTPSPIGGIVYFGAIGLGFMFVEIAMMQQLSIFMGHPVYSLVVVLGGLILSAGVGSLASDRWPVSSGWQSRMPALAAAGLVLLYSTLVIPASHAFAAAWLWQRVLISVALVAPCGFLLGFCFPIGMRWMTALSQQRNLPWMWAVNGAAGTLGSFAAILVSMETSIQTCVYAGAVCYLLASAALPAQARRTSEVPDAVPA